MLTEILMGCVLHAGRGWSGDLLVADRDDWKEESDASKSSECVESPRFQSIEDEAARRIQVGDDRPKFKRQQDPVRLGPRNGPGCRRNKN